MNLVKSGLYGDCYVEECFEHCGYICIVLVNSGCLRNGYVGIPKEHPLYEKSYHYNDIDCYFDVHGGLTYAGKIMLPETENLWFFGFDTGHYDDAFCVEDALKYGVVSPKEAEYIGRINIFQQERNLDYVKNECIKLAEELKDYEKNCE